MSARTWSVPSGRLLNLLKSTYTEDAPLSKKNSPAARACRIRQNESHPCNAQGCARHRIDFSFWCRYHKRQVYVYGWPEGRRIMPKEYLGERQEAQRFLESHAKHPAVVAALSFFSKWLGDAAELRDVPAKADLYRLHTAGVTPVDMLVETSAVFLLSRRRPKALPDGRPLIHGLGTATLYLSKRNTIEVFTNGKREVRPMRHSGATRRKVGKLIWDALGVFFLNLEQGIEREHTERGNQARAIRTPFTNTTTNTKQET